MEMETPTLKYLTNVDFGKPPENQNEVIIFYIFNAE